MESLISLNNITDKVIALRDTLYSQEDYKDAMELTKIISDLQMLSADILIDKMEAEKQALDKIINCGAKYGLRK